MKRQDTLVTEFGKGKKKGTASNMFIDGDIMYSWGHHFPLLVRMPHWGKDKYLLNADTYSPSTSLHQRLCFHLATVQIPFSALNQALNGEMPGSPTGYSIRFDVKKLHLIDKDGERWDWTGKWNYCYGEKEGRYGREVVAKVISNAEYEKLPIEEKGKCDKLKERRPEACVIRYGRKYYLSSMDGNNFFISLLPGKVETVDQAFEALKPAEINGTEYKRQGEWFFVPVSVTVPRKEIQKKKPLTNRLTILPRHHYVRDYALVFGHKHPIVRGTVRHTQGDHGILKLGEDWHLAIESNHKGSWGAQGRVD
jgi:hypothetical protein